MLPTRDPSQDKRLTQTESEGLETNFPSKRTGKKKEKGSKNFCPSKQRGGKRQGRLVDADKANVHALTRDRKRKLEKVAP